MCGAIDFDDQFDREAGKVGDVGSDGMLPSKAQAIDCVAAQMCPENDFGTRHFAAESFGEEL